MASDQCIHIDTEDFRDYLWETFQRKMVERPWGFYTYKVFENYIYLNDIYVKPLMRGKGFCREALNEIEDLAEELDKNYIGTKVSTCDVSWETNLEICEHLGFGRAKISPEYVFFMKRRD